MRWDFNNLILFLFAASFAQSLNKFDIIVPQRVNYHGEFISHNVHHLLDDSRARAHVHRRDVSDDVYRHYKVNVEGKDLHVTLKPNHKLFGPGLVAEWRDSRYGNVSGSRIKAMRKNKCHFEGEIRGHPRSRAAITTCNGLVSPVFISLTSRIQRGCSGGGGGHSQNIGLSRGGSRNSLKGGFWARILRRGGLRSRSVGIFI